MDAPSNSHIRGLDSLRFIAALWVAFGHGAGVPFRELLQQTGRFGQTVAAINGVSFNGVAAVTVFFLISGFCIHLPYSQAKAVPIREYFVRRYVRIGAPLVVILLVAHFWPDRTANIVHDVLWSVYCELAYYTLYPIIFPLLRRGHLKALIGFTTVVSILLIVLRWQYLRVTEFGLLAFVVAYPTWLLGCLLAESLDKLKNTTRTISIWYWRLSAWLYSVLAMLLVYHSPIRIGYPGSLLLFSFFSYFWLQQELVRWTTSAPLRWLENAGKWSYSVYLIHMIVIAEFAELRGALPTTLWWILLLAVIFGVSYLFFLVVERPSHLAARRWARSLRPTVVGTAKSATA
jgi:peptidoglycan/LPS O-acetylase OafA/YrhL